MAEQLLEGIIPDELYRAYRVLLEERGCSSKRVPETLGPAEVVTALLDRGMALEAPEPGEAPRLIPTPPHLALQAVLAEMNQRLSGEHERFLAGHRRLIDYVPAPSTGESEQDKSRGLIQVVTEPEEITRLSGVLVNAARRDWLTLENYVTDRPIDDTMVIAPPPALRSGVRCRTIYESRFAEHPVVAENIAGAAELGEESRLLAGIGMKMKLVDASVALLPLGPTGMTGAVVVRSPVIVGALREYFELLWERATPIGAVRPDNPLSEDLRAVLELLAQGADDDAIARRLKISTTTVRRRFSLIREELGAASRFAAGAAAVRRGWIQ
ncbi:LuxR C-terminal-related transcriptional regulator [Actinomadura rupiterrae]|uniref:LuxR C-terminal-related transcriptional regulator n=1 Tax=Actinomadura rupiterrae TaxID=559627 RepID=UPI0020A5B913|nr:LuxR C-terminal-related transcriptional regulator [Actinomadura rupiterrae]MCP2337954.1 DNA-binding CsgD family transcriptional regulator [Actinomadura rupiterrae]